MVNVMFNKHLMERARHAFVEVFENSWIDQKEELITFPLWNLSGRLCGYQQYNWQSHKKMRNDDKGRYWTYRTKESVSVFGLEYFDMREVDTLYVVEGVWDAITLISLNKPCIATLSNDPKWLRSWLNTLPIKTIALCDGDKAGKKLGKSCDGMIILPEGKDCNDLSPHKLLEVLKV